MKALKEFKYHLNGNSLTVISEGEDIPEIAQEYAMKNGYAEEAKKTPANKSKSTPRSK
ncbi:hypothetical protein [Paraglaciecola sp.]|uniref:hypothetical protein n=1 Tax=Paraglaciecola sp. TaxID=1920173 RepID=UPI003EF4F653